MSTLLQFSKVKYQVGKHKIIEDLDFTVKKGDIIALLGSSGVGKTTLLHLALELIKPTGGSIDSQAASVSCVFQEPRLLPWFSARKNIALGLKAKGVPADGQKQKVDAIAARMGLTLDDLEKYPASLSGGMKQRVALARALVTSPDVLFLDEPFNALDFAIKQTLHELLIHEIERKKLTVLFITHDLLEAAFLAKSIVLMTKAPDHLSEPIICTVPWAGRDTAWRFEQAAKLMKREDFQRAFEQQAET